MTSVSDDQPAAEAALRDALERSLRAAESRPLPEVMRDVAAGLLDALAGEWAAIVMWAADGRPELVAIAGDDAAALAEINGPRTSADLPTDSSAPTDTTGTGTVLTVPLLVRGRAAGVVYVGGPVVGGEFPDREAFVHTAAAGVAAIIERARTVQANLRRERWLAGGTEIARALTAGDHPQPLTMIAERASEIADAEVVLLLGPGAVPGMFRVDAAVGLPMVQPRRQIADTEDGHIHRVLTEGRAIRIDDLGAAFGRTDLPIGSSLLAPMHGSTGLRGVMAFGRSGTGTFTEAELGMATMFAGTVALALELAESQSHREQTALILERDRIARDLHDHVIQRLYAIGLTMQHVSSLVDDETADRLVGSVIDIDAAIAQIRSTIFRLTTPILSGSVSLRSRADALVDELEPVLGYRPSLVSEGPLDFGLDDDLVTDCEAVLREGITNIARHADATRADLAIVVSSDQVRLEIADNGRGLGDTGRRSGLANMRQRAEQYGGTLEVVTGDTGTRLVWTVPLTTAGR